MPRKKVLLTVVTYPLPSRSYDELVCTAGLLETGEWIRIYPVPLSFLIGQRKSGKVKSFKYNWIELDLKRRTDDFRPESHSPIHYDFEDLVVINTLGTDNNWQKRKSICLQNVYTNLEQLISDSKEPTNKSLATFKPTSITSFEIEKDSREWRHEWKEIRKQGDLFAQNKPPEKIIPKLPYKFFYRFTDELGKSSRMMIEDWEIGALYWNCLQAAKNDEETALQKLREKFEYEFITKKDIYFFLGTTKQWHRRRSPNPFVIIGIFYPKKASQLALF